MRKLITALLGGAALAAAAASPLAAQTVTPLTVGGGWNVFYFNIFGGDPSIQDAYGNDLQYTFDLTSKAVLEVTDGYYDGDQFDFVINSVDQGPTSTPTADGTDRGDNWEDALNDPRFSSAVYVLGAGDYTVTGYIPVIGGYYQTYFGYGAGAVNLTAYVPEPASWALMLVGVGGIGALARRRGRGIALAV